LVVGSTKLPFDPIGANASFVKLSELTLVAAPISTEGAGGGTPRRFSGPN
jgi:hypothetical protein